MAEHAAEGNTAGPAAGHAGGSHSAIPYVLVWLGLLGLTVLTYLTGKQHWGAWALPIAMTIAACKSGLVILFFMHMREDKSAARLVLLVSFLFVLLLLGLTLSDVATRFRLATPAGAPFGTENSTPMEGLKEHEAPDE